MFIEEIKIDRYGPISFKIPVRLSPFTLFFGQNEAGKSLTIDAFVKFLLGKESSNFYKINRVDEYPNGFLIINIDGNRIKLPEKGTLKTNTKLNLEVSDFKNVFIVRGSNLEIPDNSDFFLEVTERLTGIKATIIDKIKGEIREIASLTLKNNAFKDTKDIQLKTRIERAGKTIKEIDSLLEELKSRDFDRLVQMYVDDGERLEEVNKRLSDLNNARFRDEYLKALAAISELRNIKEEYDRYKEFNEDIRQKWYDLIKERKRINTEIENEQTKLNSLKLDIKNLKNELNKNKEEFLTLNNRMNEVVKIVPQIEELSENDSKLEKISVKRNRIFKPLIYISIIFLVLATALSIFKHTMLPFISGFGFLLFSLVGYFGYNIKKANQKKSIRRIRNILAKYGIDPGNDEIRDIEFAVQKFEEYSDQKKREVDEYKNNLEVMKKLYEELERKINEDRKRVNDIDESIDLLKEDYNVDNYDEFCKNLDKKIWLYNKQIVNINYLKKVFITRVEEYSVNREERIITENDLSFWEGKLRSLEKYKNLAAGIEYDQVEYDSLLSEKEDIKEEISSLARKLEDLKSRMENLEREVNNILRTGSDYLHLSKSVDLEKAKEMLISFINANNRKRELAILAIHMFDEIKKKKREEISGLFSENNDISDMYKEISGGKYQEIIYNSDESRIIVKDKSGMSLEVDKLSSGAFDQLYFSLRIALARRLLRDKKGFFIMDDPFIRSDKQRLIKQLKTMENIVNMGWQILYFSAKDEVREVLERDIKNVDINIVEMSRIIV